MAAHYRSTVRKIWHIFCVCVSRPMTLTFDNLTLKLVRNVALFMVYYSANIGGTTAIRFRFMGIRPTRLRLITGSCDLDL